MRGHRRGRVGNRSGGSARTQWTRSPHLGVRVGCGREHQPFASQSPLPSRIRSVRHDRGLQRCGRCAEGRGARHLRHSLSGASLDCPWLEEVNRRRHSRRRRFQGNRGGDSRADDRCGDRGAAGSDSDCVVWPQLRGGSRCPAADRRCCGERGS